MGSNGNLPFMPSRFEHRATLAAGPATVYSTLVDEAFLTARLRDIGGKGAALLDHRTSDDGPTIRLRQVVDAEVKVGIPLIGGKIEKVVAEQVTKLLAAEAEYAEKWLAEHA